MKAEISIVGNAFCCRTIESGQECRIELTPEAKAELGNWQTAYALAVRTSQNELLPAIGKKMLHWLNQNNWASSWLNGQGSRELIIGVHDIHSDEARLLLDAPWELLSTEDSFLAGDSTQEYVVTRRIAPFGTSDAPAPEYSDLAVVFMAASPRGQKELDFEAEEAAIIRATRRLPLSLFVEESGCQSYLKDKLALEGPFEAVHLSCHGDIIPSQGPVLILEDEEGKEAVTPPATIIDALGEKKPSLVFLSACRTAEGNRENLTEGAAKSLATASDSFSQSLISAGVANVLGWDGSVYDRDALFFAERFYDGLARYESPAYSAASARRLSLLSNLDDPATGRHWHLARLYIGAAGGRPLCRRDRPRRRLTAAARNEFLDRSEKRVPVATALEFVGRRRQAQEILRLFREQNHAGVLIHGMGNIGKSSLAARIAGRLPRLKPVVIYKDYDALSIFDRLMQAVAPARRNDFRHIWRDSIGNSPASLQEAIEDLFDSVFSETPILMIIDDFEQILETPTRDNTRIFIKDSPGYPDEWRTAISAVIKAFDACRPANSRLIFTSRYQFILLDSGGRDLAECLARIQLPPMSSRERTKQWEAARTITGAGSHGLKEPEPDILEEIIEAAGGNPGLQQVLSNPLLSGELQAARTALHQVQHWKKTGNLPKDPSEAQDFFIRISFETYLDALTDSQQSLLRIAVFFSENVPIPRTALTAAAVAVGISDPESDLDRLTALGLIDQWEEINTIPHMAANPLARPLAAAPFTGEEASLLAENVFSPMVSAWQRSDTGFPDALRSVELARIALMTEVPLELLEKIVIAASDFLFYSLNDATKALALLKPAIQMMDRRSHQPSPGFILAGANCAERLGDRVFQLDLLNRGQTLETDDVIGLAQIKVLFAKATLFDNTPEKTLETLRESAGLFKKEQDERSHAVTMGYLADILQQQGETAEALRIRKEEELPVYDKLGDVRSRAVTMGKIADILQQQGETAEALRIRKEEELPVYDKLGDVRSRAVTMGKIADILQQQGETAEALRIRKEEQLPVYDKLGDVRSRAVTMGQIADILQQQGETAEALRIRKEEQLPVYDKLGDVRSRAVTMGQIADILQQQGETAEALRIRKEEELPVYDKLGDVRSRAVTMGQIADILQQQGETAEALRIRKEEQLPVYDKLGDVRSRAVTMGQIADILQQQGETTEALRIRKEEQLPVYDKLGDVRSRAVTMGYIADILQQQGETTEALRIRKEEELPVYDKLGDVRSRAVTMGKIADILQQQGETAEALRIRKEEELPVYDKLGDVRSRAVTMGQIADILQQQGETAEALRIRKEEELPVYDKLGDVRSRAVTMGQIADILQQQGETAEALRIRKEEELPVYDKLGDVRSRAVTMGKIADILQQQGETAEALRIRKEEELPVYDKLGDVRSRAVTMGKIADILQQQGETAEALRIRKEEELPVYDKLGDVRSRAVTMGKIADILQQQGETAEALRIHIEERLPVAEKMEDLDQIAHIRFSCAQIRLSISGLEQEDGQVILDELSESFTINSKLKRIDGIAYVGSLLGQVLAMVGYAKEAVDVLGQSAAAFKKMGRNEEHEQIKGLQETIIEKFDL